MSAIILAVKIWAAFLIVLNCTALLILTSKGTRFDFFRPSVIYDNISVNWFGAWFLSILLHLVFSIVVILYWIYKAFTAGRK